MATFAVMRHTETGGLGVVPAGAMEMQRAHGWVRVSDYRDQPSDFHLPDFADTFDDLDAQPEPEPKAVKKAATTKRESSE
jgi:hypothetical protein